MKRLFAVGALAVALGAMFVSSSGSAADPKAVKDIMKQAHSKGDGLLSKIGAELGKKKDTNWDTVSSSVKDLALLAGDLEKNTPKKGTKESWEKLTKTYGENVGKLSTAAEKKDVGGAGTALKSLQGSCGGCHSKHK
ncbi:MAG TPA: cytochrome c [Gemmataceae bacterium]|jgi:cytochrome c556|nr:cytochrome c [Gemmataceae bacterium]